MCGITGIVNLKKELKITDSLINMTKSMTKRGPDDEGYVLFNSSTGTPFHGDDSIEKQFTHVQNSKSNHYKLGLGFRQLKIIDLSNNSHQPMTDASKNYWIVFNGEIYNYKEIRLELEALGYHFNSNSDTEVLLKAYIEWSEKSLDKLNGMFAFAIYNIAKNELFIARDRMGIKPLYYYLDKDYFLFGSTITSIASNDNYVSEIDKKGLWQNFRFSIAQSPSTCFKNISSLKSGHLLRLNLNTNEVKIEEYWDIPIGIQDESLSKIKAKEILEESLYKAINYRTNADVDVGSFMSGGIDSTTISVIANKVTKNITTLTLGYKDAPKLNEIKQATDTAKIHNLPHKISYLKARSILNNIEQTTLSYEEPYHSLSGNFNIAKIAQQNNLKVVLNGLGGDELFGGYSIYRKIGFWEKYHKYSAISKHIPNITNKVIKGKKILEYNSIENLYDHYFSLYEDNELEKLFLDYSLNTSQHLSTNYNHNSKKFDDNFEAISYYNLKSYIGDYQMRSTDKSLMHFSVEGRFPMLDHTFIETAFKIPSKYKTHNNNQKIILKEIAKKHISKSCLEMKKKGLSLPLEKWMNDELKEFTYDTLNSLKNRNYFNNNEIDHILKSKNPFKIWQLVSTEIWMQNFF